MNIPHILLTNDDGVDAMGIRILAELLSNFADVLVMAPDGARSGAACSITPHTPLCYKKKSEYSRIQVYACSGTPVDCIKLALEQFPDFKPDVIVSGVNHGDNASVSVHYSGTMGAVLEGCMKGYSSVGFSICDFSSDADFSAIGKKSVKTSLCITSDSQALHTPILCVLAFTRIFTAISKSADLST